MSSELEPEEMKVSSIKIRASVDRDKVLYQSELKEEQEKLEQKLEEIKVRLQGVSSPRLEGVYIVKDPHKSDKLYWLEVEKKWIKES